MRRSLLLLLALTLTTPFWGLGHSAWEVDDARYLEVPREMAESGDWLTPTLDTLPYVEKPPMVYWLGAASYKTFGFGEASGRLPLALLSLLGLLGTLWLGTWLFSPRVGIWGTLLLGTCAAYSSLSHAVTPDMPLTVSLLWTTALALRCLRRPADSAWAGPLAWLALGAAFLCKGLVAPLLAFCWVAGLLLFFPDLRKGWRPLALNWGMPVALFSVGAWVAAMEWANPGFLRYFFLEQHFQRFLTPFYNRPGPPYYYFAIELAGALPWTPLVVAGTLVPLLRWRTADERELQLLLWAVGVFVFFSLSESKLPTYILPLFPHQALLAARLAGRLMSEERARRWIQGAGEVLAAVLLFSCALAPFIVSRIGLLGAADPRLLALSAGGGLACAGAALAMLGTGRGRELRGAASAALALQAFLLLGTRAMEDQLSFRGLGLELKARAAELERQGFAVDLLTYDRFVHGLPLYLGRPVKMMNWTGELYYARRFPRYEGWFSEATSLKYLPAPGRKTFVVLPRAEAAWVSSMSRPGAIRGMMERGPWMVFEY